MRRTLFVSGCAQRAIGWLDPLRSDEALCEVASHELLQHRLRPDGREGVIAAFDDLEPKALSRAQALEAIARVEREVIEPGIGGAEDEEDVNPRVHEAGQIPAHVVFSAR